MSLYTEDNLDKLLEKGLIAIIPAMQSKMSADNTEVLEEIHKLNSKSDIMQSDLVVTKKVNSEFSSRLVNMERQCWANAQYLSMECLEVVGIAEVEQKDLEGKVLPVLEKVGCKIDPNEIEDCHQLSKKSDNVII